MTVLYYSQQILFKTWQMSLTYLGWITWCSLQTHNMKSIFTDILKQSISIAAGNHLQDLNMLDTRAIICPIPTSTSGNLINVLKYLKKE